MQKIIPVILSGGSGPRLWPLSSADIPKHFLKLLDKQTLLQKTVLHALNVAEVPESDVIILAHNNNKPEIIRQLEEISPSLSRHVLSEPQSKDTAPAIAYAANYARTHFGEDALIWVLPSDHYIGDEDILSKALNESMHAVEDDYLVTFGVEPTRPETTYGYIRKAEKLESSKAYKTSTFVTNPPPGLAYHLVKSGQYLWNSGMHIFKIASVLDNYHRYAPVLLGLVQRSIMESTSDQRPSAVFYSLIKEDSFESAILQKSDKMAVIACDPSWSDVNAWDNLWEVEQKNEPMPAQERLIVCASTESIVTGADTMNNLVIAMQKNSSKESMTSARV